MEYELKFTEGEYKWRLCTCVCIPRVRIISREAHLAAVNLKKSVFSKLSLNLKSSSFSLLSIVWIFVHEHEINNKTVLSSI
jgi:hypothetical protein